MLALGTLGGACTSGLDSSVPEAMSPGSRDEILGLSCEASLRLAGAFHVGAPQPEDVFGCWPVGEWVGRLRRQSLCQLHLSERHTAGRPVESAQRDSCWRQLRRELDCPQERRLGGQLGCCGPVRSVRDSRRSGCAQD